MGDIVISAETALRDAEKSGMAFNDELAFLMIHGVLHLLDYNHENVSKVNTQTMKKKEQELFYMLKGYEIQMRVTSFQDYDLTRMYIIFTRQFIHFQDFIQTDSILLRNFA